MAHLGFKVTPGIASDPAIRVRIGGMMRWSYSLLLVAAAAGRSYPTRIGADNLPGYPNTQLKIPTARDATRAMVASEITDSAIISSFARTVSGNVSAGENAVAFVNAKNR